MINLTIERVVRYWGPYDGGIDDIIQDIGSRGLLGKARKRFDYQLLYCMAKTLGGPVLEQGSSYGLSTRCIARGLNLSHPDKPRHWAWRKNQWVYSVDLKHQDRGIFSEHESDWALNFHTADSTTFLPGDECVWGFEDTSHTYETTKANLERQIESGCHTVLVHDCGKHVQGPKGDVIWDCRRAALEVFSKWDLIDISSDSGMILAQKKGEGM